MRKVQEFVKFEESDTLPNGELGYSAQLIIDGRVFEFTDKASASVAYDIALQTFDATRGWWDRSLRLAVDMLSDVCVDGSSYNNEDLCGECCHLVGGACKLQDGWKQERSPFGPLRTTYCKTSIERDRPLVEKESIGALLHGSRTAKAATGDFAGKTLEVVCCDQYGDFATVVFAVDGVKWTASASIERDALDGRARLTVNPRATRVRS